MDNETEMKIIARIKTDFPTKFGVPRQSGIIDSLKAQIIFEPEYRIMQAVRGLENFTHIWLIWEFSEAVRDSFSPTVRPPRLGGNKRIGVFATRSPFRPNPIGLSCVKLDYIDFECEMAPVLHISGADLMDSTPIFDIKPYLPYADAHPEAGAGFTENITFQKLSVHFPEELLAAVPEVKRASLIEVLSSDPRPAYHSDPERVYGFTFAGFEIKFTVSGDDLTVTDVYPASN